MRRRATFDHEGNEVTAEDVLDGVELAAYRREHPRPKVHQVRFYPPPENACDECQADLGANQGGLCGWCAIQFADKQNEEYWL